MKWIQIIACIFVLGTTIAAPLAVRACPLCSEAIADSSNSSGDDEVSNFPAAMNQSIYLMVSMPYLALGIVGVCIYRGFKKNAAYLEAMRQDNSPDE